MIDLPLREFEFFRLAKKLDQNPLCREHGDGYSLFLNVRLNDKKCCFGLTTQRGELREFLTVEPILKVASKYDVSNITIGF